MDMKKSTTLQTVRINVNIAGRHLAQAPVAIHALLMSLPSSVRFAVIELRRYKDNFISLDRDPSRSSTRVLDRSQENFLMETLRCQRRPFHVTFKGLDKIMNFGFRGVVRSKGVMPLRELEPKQGSKIYRDQNGFVMHVSRIAAQMQYTWYMEGMRYMHKRRIPHAIKERIMLMAFGCADDTPTGVDGVQARKELSAQSALYFADFNCVNAISGMA